MDLNLSLSALPIESELGTIGTENLQGALIGILREKNIYTASKKKSHPDPLKKKI